MTTVVSYPLGTPPAAAMRGGDCRARDLTLARNVYGLHRFAATTDVRISNGLLRLTLGSTGALPTLAVDVRRGSLVSVGDTYADTYADTYGGAPATPSWLAMGTLIIDSPSISTLLADVRLARVSAESVTLHLISDTDTAYVVLRRGERMVSIQHGDGALIARRITWTDSPSPVGTASYGLVQEIDPHTDGCLRFVGSLEPVTANAGAFSLLSLSATPRLIAAAGVGTWNTRDGAEDMRIQIADHSRKQLVLS